MAESTTTNKFLIITEDEKYYEYEGRSFSEILPTFIENVAGGWNNGVRISGEYWEKLEDAIDEAFKQKVWEEWSTISQTGSTKAIERIKLYNALVVNPKHKIKRAVTFQGIYSR